MELKPIKMLKFLLYCGQTRIIHTHFCSSGAAVFQSASNVARARLAYIFKAVPAQVQSSRDRFFVVVDSGLG